jgi:hypothetical protein
LENSSTGAAILNSLLTSGPALATKIFVVAGLVMYTIFTLVVLKQVGIMTETFDSEINGTVKMFARVHLLMSIGITVLAVLVLP